MNEKYSVHYSPEAKDDLRGIYRHIAVFRKAPGNAKGQVNRIRREIRSLSFMPSRYGIVDWEPWKSMQMHKIPVDNFVIYYAVDREQHTVTVVRIFYGGRDVEGIINAEQK